MITSPEQCRTDADVAEFERYLDFVYARRRLIAVLANLPLIEAPGNRTLLTRTVFSWWRRQEPVHLPGGWTMEKCWDRSGLILGPSWYLAPRRWLRELRWKFYDLAIDIRLAECPYDGCRESELRWFPDAPRFA